MILIPFYRLQLLLLTRSWFLGVEAMDLRHWPGSLKLLVQSPRILRFIYVVRFTQIVTALSVI